MHGLGSLSWTRVLRSGAHRFLVCGLVSRAWGFVAMAFEELGLGFAWSVAEGPACMV